VGKARPPCAAVVPAKAGTHTAESLREARCQSIFLRNATSDDSSRTSRKPRLSGGVPAAQPPALNKAALRANMGSVLYFHLLFAFV